MNYKKRKNSSSNEENNNNKLSTIIKGNKKKGNYNLTISCTFKENKPEQDSNKTNFVFNKNLNKYKNNKSLINNNYYLKRNMFDSIGDINNLQENNIINNNDKNIYLNNNRYHLSDHNTPITVKQKNKFDLSTINIGKINNIFYKFPKDNFINSNYINNGLDKNNKVRKSCDENINNNHKKFIINEDSTQNSIFSSNNNIKELEPDKVQKKIKKKY